LKFLDTSKIYDIGKTMLNNNTITNPGPNLAYNRYLQIMHIQNKGNSSTPENSRNTVPNLKGVHGYSYSDAPNFNNNNPIMIHDYSKERNYYGNENRNHATENPQNSYQNYIPEPANNYNRYNSQTNQKLIMAGNSIMK